MIKPLRWQETGDTGSYCLHRAVSYSRVEHRMNVGDPIWEGTFRTTPPETVRIHGMAYGHITHVMLSRKILVRRFDLSLTWTETEIVELTIPVCVAD